MFVVRARIGRLAAPPVPVRGIAATLVLGIAVAVLAVPPLLERGWARARVQRRLAAISPAAYAPDRWRVRLPAEAPAGLAAWTSIGGCGAAGSSASGAGGGIQWVGRNVSGGLVDAQVLTTETRSHGNRLVSVASRLRTDLGPHLGIALNVPIVYKVGEVSVLGMTKEARIAGFGDLSCELAYKFGRIAQHQLMLTASAPTGASDAVRQGVVLPQHLQLGAGTPGLTLQYQHTRDQDWGLLLVGGTVGYPGWENAIGDYRAPSATAYVHAGYIWGPFVPAAGLSLFAKPVHDRERGAVRPADRDPRFMLVPSLSWEWSSDLLALLPAATIGLSPAGVESVSIGLGVATSLF